MISHATVSDHGAIQAVFKQYEPILPYIRQDYLTRNIMAGTVIWDSGVCVIYHHCKVNRSLGLSPGKVSIHKGDMMLSEIASCTPGSGHAGRILERFFQEYSATIWLTVRADNTRACAFYEKHHMIHVGTMTWAEGTIPGRIYTRPTTASLDFLL